MGNVLIISRVTMVSAQMKEELSRFGLSGECQSMQSLMAQDETVFEGFDYATLIIDENFRRDLINHHEEIDLIIRKISNHINLYALFDREYDSFIEPWLQYIRRVYTSTCLPTSLELALKEMNMISLGSMKNTKY